MPVGEAYQHSGADEVEGGFVMPFYLVCDLSASMRQGGRIRALQDALASLRDAFFLNPVVSDCARLCVIGFSNRARVVLPLCDLADAEDLPRLEPEGLTNFAPAFHVLRETIQTDAELLRADGLRVWRPMVFVFSDGAPTDDPEHWRRALESLHDPMWPARPDIVSFGVGEAVHEVLAEIATLRCYVSPDPDFAAGAIASVGDLVVRSVVASGSSGEPVLPDRPPEGFDELDIL